MSDIIKNYVARKQYAKTRAEEMASVTKYDYVAKVNGDQRHIILMNGDKVFINTTDINESGFIGLVKYPNGRKVFERIYRTGGKIFTHDVEDFNLNGEFAEGEIEILGKVTALYREIQDEPLPCGEWEKNKLLKAAKKVDVKSYGITCQDIRDIATKNSTRLFDSIIDAFNCGFIKGQRVEKAKKRQSNKGKTEEFRRAEQGGELK